MVDMPALAGQTALRSDLGAIGAQLAAAAGRVTGSPGCRIAGLSCPCAPMPPCPRATVPPCHRATVPPHRARRHAGPCTPPIHRVAGRCHVKTGRPVGCRQAALPGRLQQDSRARHSVRLPYRSRSVDLSDACVATGECREAAARTRDRTVTRSVALSCSATCSDATCSDVMSYNVMSCDNALALY